MSRKIETIRDYFIADPDETILSFINAWCSGERQGAITLNADGEIVITNGGRDLFAVVGKSHDLRHPFVVWQYEDPIDMVDPDADSTFETVHDTVAQAVVEACRSVGCPIELSTAPAP